MSVLDAAKLLADGWPANAMLAPETGLPVCIQTTRHVVLAFRKAGVPDVRPLPCALYLFNAPATAYVMTGTELPGAVRVEVTPEAKGKTRRGWWGHLVVDHPDFLLDLVLPGVIASTGAKGFDDVTAFCGEKGNTLVDVDGTWMALTDRGQCFRYQPRPELSSWRNTSAWRGGDDLEVIDNLAQHIKELL